MVAQALLAVKVVRRVRGGGAYIRQRVLARSTPQPLSFLTCRKRSSLPFTMKSVVLCVLVVVAAVAAAPQREGAAYTREAIKQAQSTHLIPKDAEIHKVQEGIELGAYESIPINQRINLYEILGDQVPSEVINNLQGQIDQIGHH